MLNRTSTRPCRRRSSTAANTTATSSSDHYRWNRDRESEGSSTTSGMKPNTPKLSPQTSSPSADPSSTKSGRTAIGPDRPEQYRVTGGYYSRMVPGGQYPFLPLPRPHEGDEVVRSPCRPSPPGEVLEGEVVILDY